MKDLEYRKAEAMMKAKRSQLWGTEKLIDLGGFIKEAVESRILSLYPAAVSEAAERYCPIGPGFWDVVDAAQDAFNRYTDYNEMDYYCSEKSYIKWLIRNRYNIPEDESLDFLGKNTEESEKKYDELANKVVEGVSDDDFFAWLLDQAARCGKERCSCKHDIWEKTQLPRSKQGVKTELSPLEERIISLSYGLDGDGKKSAIEISQMPEFSCHPFYIISVLNYAETVLARFNLREESFSLCSERDTANKDGQE